MRYSTCFSLSLTLLSWVAVVRSQNCVLQVPANPLTAEGLATPYVATGCNQIDFANQGNFVEAAILDPATGSIQIYTPLVINQGMVPVGSTANSTSSAPTDTHTSTGTRTSAGATSVRATTSATTSTAKTASANVGTTHSTRPSSFAAKPSTTVSARPATTLTPRQAATSPGFYIPPIKPTLPDGAIVGIWFGSNAGSLTLSGDTQTCVNGLDNSVFGQFAYCNGPAWMEAAKNAVNEGRIKLPPPGTGKGQVCPTTHDFRIVDQDQSDNVVTTYLLINGNTLAQNTPANNKANPTAEELSNASDNALVTQFIDPALGCAPFQNPCTTCPTGQGPALATDELLAFFFPPAGGPALVPLNDPMVLVNGQQSLDKVNLYRAGTGQPVADANNASGLAYCKGITAGGTFINTNQALFSAAPSPATNTATNLFTFLAMRFSASFGPAPGLGCTGLLNVANPVTLTMDGNGVVTAATINTQLLQQIVGGSMGTNPTGSTKSASTTEAKTGTPVSNTASATKTGSFTSAGKTAASTPAGVLLHPTTTVASASHTSSTTSPTTTSCYHHHHHALHRWKRVTPFAAERVRRKSRIESFE